MTTLEQRVACEHGLDRWLPGSVGRAVRADRPTVINDIGTTYFVADGTLDVFAVALDDSGLPTGRWYPLCRLEGGSMVAGAGSGARHALVTKATPGSVVVRVDLNEARRLVAEVPDAAPALCAALDAGMTSLGSVLVESLAPRDFVPLDAGREVGLDTGDVARSVDGPLWVTALEGTLWLAGRGSERRLTKNDLTLVSRSDWLVAKGPCLVRAERTVDLLVDDRLWRALATFSLRVLYDIDRRLERARAAEEDAVRERARQDAALVAETARTFAEVLLSDGRSLPLPAASHDAAFRACQTVGRAMGLTVREPVPGARRSSHSEPVARVAAASGFRTRTVRLQGTWWRSDAGPLVGFRKDGSPIALVPSWRGGYTFSDPASATTGRVTAAVAQSLHGEAESFYRPLPERPLRGRDLLRFGAHGSRRDLVVLAGCGLVVALLGLLTPILTATILGSLVPRGERHLIFELCLLLVLSAVLTAPLSLIQNIAALRIEGRAEADVQAAIWDRILSLPVRFFDRYSTGELSTAALGVNGMREALSGVTTSVVLTFFFAFVNLVLLFAYDVRLAVLGLVLVSLGLGVSAWAGVRESRQQRELFETDKRLSSKIFQLLSGLAKLRVAAAEDRAFAFWADDFANNRRLGLTARRIQNRVTAFNAAFPLFCTMTAFATISLLFHNRLSISTFLAFNVAFTQLLAATLQFTGTMITVLTVVPMSSNLRPIIEAVPEVTEDRPDPGDLTGDIEVSQVSFRYVEDGPLVLDNVSFRVQPGEYLAVVGPTGCGKSTLLRLLLAFEPPSSGSILYDGQDVTKLDVRGLRQQCGVVLQSARLFAGSILSNITSSGTYTVDEAWEAAKMAGFEEDLAAMPMGLYTILDEGATTLSGGQRQRLIIARALISRPRIVFLDEATSALDNPTQAIVTESMRRLNTSRVVIAHRLSTIVGADRILVMDSGRIVEEGTYEGLSREDGVFSRLIRRQMV